VNIERRTNFVKVVLFIGHHKVGSSSLQEFLSQNSIRLLKSRILYPAVEAQGLSVLLAKALQGKDNVETLPINAREAHNALAFTMLTEETGGAMPNFHAGLPHSNQMFRTIQQQINMLQPKAVILTAEVFANFAPRSTSLIDRLATFFQGADIRVIATFRRIDDYLASWHGQRLRFGQKVNPLRAVGIGPYRNSIHFDYKKMLDGWCKTVPQAEFILRNYSDVLANGGSVKDFIASSGLKFPRGLLPVRQANESLHRGMVEIARRGNHQLDQPDARLLRQVLGLKTPALNLPASGDVELFGAEHRENMVNTFELVHDYIGQVAGRQPFFPDMEEARTTRPYAEIEVATDALDQLQRLSGDIGNAVVHDFLKSLDLRQET